MGPATVQARCDTAEGPVVTDGRRALETGNVNYALMWVPADGEAEMREVFGKALKVRGLGWTPPRLRLAVSYRVLVMGSGMSIGLVVGLAVTNRRGAALVLSVFALLFGLRQSW